MQRPKEILHQHNAKIVERYNKYTHNLLLLEAGDTVDIQSPLNQRWNMTGKIITLLPDRQYWIRVDGWRRIKLRNYRFLRKCELKLAPTPIPNATPGPITPSSNTPLLHPYPPTSSCNGTCTTTELPQRNHKHIMPSIVENSSSSIQAITTQLTWPKRRVQHSTTRPTHGWVEKGDVEVTTLTCRINKNNTYRFNSPSWQTKIKMAGNPISNL